ncbi:MAG TPA: glycoside hydrolase family 108 protein [Rhabdaerophilum sp.]|nr:glycoside hydrolase family 108 protein [Rhabdaerophilum sp.]
MKATFDHALAVVLGHEGGYVDHPADPGGATNFGITLATLSRWRGMEVTKADVRALERDEAAAIYRARYWDAVRGDELPVGVDLTLFDFAVNSGPSRAISTLQEVLGVVVDGRIGPVTMEALGTQPPIALVKEICARRLVFLRRLATFPVFGRGWTRRIENIAREAGNLAKRGRISGNNDSKPRKEETLMDITKSIFTSRTVWTNGIGLVALLLSWFGFDTAGIDKNAVTESLFQAVAAISFVASTFFRVIASKKLL